MKVEKLNNDGCRETKAPSNSLDMVARSMVDLHTKTQNHYLGELLDHIADDELGIPDERAKGLLNKIYPLCEHMEDRVHRLEKKLAGQEDRRVPHTRNLESKTRSKTLSRTPP
jgi:hypothetical protein